MDSGAMETLVWLIPALPLAGALILLLAGRRADRWGHLLGCAAALGGFALGVIAFFDLLGRDSADRALRVRLFSWVPVAELQVDLGFQLDQLSVCFVLLITGVGALIHIYSIGYMAHGPDPAGRVGPGAPGRRRFFGYLNLFLAAMLVLVLSDSFLGLYLGWEGVGLASYLLIGFWQYRPTAATAAKKAFVVNRVGDMGLIIAMMIMFATFGSVSFTDVFAGAPGADEGTLNAIGLMLLLAACAKSAQVPLQSWLGDAMEGASRPTHFAGVATVVTKLFAIAGACRAYFGEKDFQQLAIVTRLAADLSLPVDVVGCPIVREPDGLALSSRNVYLTPEERAAAPVLHRALVEAADLVASGERSVEVVRTHIATRVADEPLAQFDYAEVVDPATMVPAESALPGVRILAAAQFGIPRLLDNVATTEGTGT